MTMPLKVGNDRSNLHQALSCPFYYSVSGEGNSNLIQEYPAANDLSYARAPWVTYCLPRVRLQVETHMPGARPSKEVSVSESACEYRKWSKKVSCAT